MEDVPDVGQGSEGDDVKVSELIALLQQEDPSADVLAGDHDSAFYDIDTVEGGVYLADGYIVGTPGSGGSPEAPEGSEPCVVLRAL